MKNIEMNETIVDRNKRNTTKIKPRRLHRDLIRKNSYLGHS